eukprot:1394639-Amorphochlora_amoeboformis.AAC.1
MKDLIDVTPNGVRNPNPNPKPYSNPNPEPNPNPHTTHPYPKYNTTTLTTPNNTICCDPKQEYNPTMWRSQWSSETF